MKFNPIGWCHFTINFWWGCTEKSPACAFCYARDIAARWSQKLFGFKVAWGDGQTRGERLQEARREALALNRSAQRRGVRYRVFANSMSDWLDSEVPAEWLAFMLETISLTPHLDWLLLTKRPELWDRRIGDALALSAEGSLRIAYEWLGCSNPPANVWIGTTVEDQTRANERIPKLVAVPAKVRFLSCEPLLSEVKLSRWIDDPCGIECRECGEDTDYVVPSECHTWRSDIGPLPRCPICGAGASWKGNLDGIHWVIAGGESGIKARPSHPDWFRSLRDQCTAAGVAFYFKQWGEWTQRCLMEINGKPCGDGRTDAGPLPMCHCEDGHTLYVQRVGNKRAGRVLDGVEHSAFPKS